jgi:hypothetical protein
MNMSKLIRWNTPFVEIHNPSIGLYLEHGKKQRGQAYTFDKIIIL